MSALNLDLIFSGSLPLVFLLVLLTTVAVCGLVSYFGAKTLHIRNDLAAVQASHHQPVPRLGGIAIFASMVAITLSVSLTPWYLDDWIVLLLAIFPIFLVGTLEDLGFRMPPLTRLGAILLSGLITSLYWDLWVVDLGIPVFETLTAYSSIAIMISIFMAAGVTNGFNLIDGLNGLLGFYTLSTSLTLCVFGLYFELQNIAAAGMLFSMISLGFLLFNFPRARIFMGDAGAYMLGHFLVWVAIGMQGDVSERGGYVSPFAILLIFFWPVADTALAVWRRRIKKRPSFHPDRLHIHHLMRRCLEIRYLGRGCKQISNPLATVALAPFFLATQIAAFWLAEDEIGSFLAVLCFGGLYFGSYILAVRFSGKISGRRRSSSLERSRATSSNGRELV